MHPMTPTEFAERVNLFLYRQHIRKLGPSEIEVAREWCFNLIRREHPQWSQEEVERFYENLIHVKITAVDVASGEFVVFDRNSGVPLIRAVVEEAKIELELH